MDSSEMSSSRAATFGIGCLALIGALNLATFSFISIPDLFLIPRLCWFPQLLPPYFPPHIYFCFSLVADAGLLVGAIGLFLHRELARKFLVTLTFLAFIYSIANTLISIPGIPTQVDGPLIDVIPASIYLFYLPILGVNAISFLAPPTAILWFLRSKCLQVYLSGEV